MTNEASGTTVPGSLVAFAQLRVVELGQWIAAPAASALFADLGADVIKVEPPRGDPGRRWFKSIGLDVGIQPTFALDNRRKRSVVLDLAEEADRAGLDKLLETADVLITNMRITTLKRLGLDHETVLAAHPHLVYGSITAFGLAGPDAEQPGFDVGSFWARSGLSHQLAGDAPLHAPGSYGDHITGLALFAAVMAGLYERSRTGRGGLVETSLLQAASWILGPDLAVLSAFGKVHPVAHRSEAVTPLVNSYRTADDKWIFLTGVEAMRHFPAVCAAVGHPELVDDPRFADAQSIRKNRRDLIAILDAAFAQASYDEWARRLDEAGAWWQKVNTPAEVLEDPQLAANGWIEDVEVAPGRSVRMLTRPVTVFGHRELNVARAPERGQDNSRLLSDSDTPALAPD
jgi:crotonobetainyl-CoA:carnitine CoA-transferase CaiB-like acyl-CoA transferase